AVRFGVGPLFDLFDHNKEPLEGIDPLSELQVLDLAVERLVERLLLGVKLRARLLTHGAPEARSVPRRPRRERLLEPQPVHQEAALSLTPDFSSTGGSVENRFAPA